MVTIIPIYGMILRQWIIYFPTILNRIIYLQGNSKRINYFSIGVRINVWCSTLRVPCCSIFYFEISECFPKFEKWLWRRFYCSPDAPSNAPIRYLKGKRRKIYGTNLASYFPWTWNRLVSFSNPKNLKIIMKFCDLRHIEILLELFDSISKVPIP